MSADSLVSYAALILADAEVDITSDKLATLVKAAGGSVDQVSLFWNMTSTTVWNGMIYYDLIWYDMICNKMKCNDTIRYEKIYIERIQRDNILAKQARFSIFQRQGTFRIARFIKEEHQ